MNNAVRIEGVALRYSTDPGMIRARFEARERERESEGLGCVQRSFVRWTSDGVDLMVIHWNEIPEYGRTYGPLLGPSVPWKDLRVGGCAPTMRFDDVWTAPDWVEDVMVRRADGPEETRWIAITPQRWPA